MYIDDNNNGVQISYSELVAANPNKSLPADRTNIILTIWFYIHPASQPAYDQYKEEVTAVTPIKIGNEYFQTWEVRLLDQDHQDVIMADQKEIKYEAIWNQADIEKSDAQATFIQDQSGNGNKGNIRANDRLNKKHSKITNKLFKGQNLSPKEQEFSDAYDELLDYEDDVDKEADKSEKNLSTKASA